MHYDIVRGITTAEYEDRMNRGWRRFGHSLFRPECASCKECRSIRVPVETFHQSRSQKRVWAMNKDVTLSIGEPCVTEEKLELHRKYHAFQSDFKGWPDHHGSTAEDYTESFVLNPFPTEEWCYHVGDRLLGVGYVDCVPGGLSAIYFYYDPDERRRSLGTWNVLMVLAAAANRQLPHVYLGFYVRGCRSLEYKANFRPNQVLDRDTGEWSPFVT